MVEIADGVHWVGAVDWDIRDFHGYITHRGTTYNSYLVVGDRVALVDGVKSRFYEEWVRHIEEYVGLGEIDYLVSNHAEPDHSGTIARLHREAPQAEIVASPRGKATLEKYYGALPVTTIKERPTLDLGGKTLSFVEVPMAHWPDSMVSYIPEDRVLLSNDAFGQHLASSQRFDDQVDQGVLWQEATAYYANILMPLRAAVRRALKQLEGVPVEVIAPSHGVVWRGSPGAIVEGYSKWIDGYSQPKVVVAYDTMWGSTRELAYAIAEGVAQGGVDCRVYCLRETHRSDVVTEVLEAKAVLVGSPALNNHVYPTVAGFLAYLRGLKPYGKLGAAFGSLGWSGGAVRFVEEQLKLGGLELLEGAPQCSFKPTAEEWREAYEFGLGVARRVLEDSGT